MMLPGKVKKCYDITVAMDVLHDRSACVRKVGHHALKTYFLVAVLKDNFAIKGKTW